tara:strand:- start:24 stop:425 length:402 start_codon:yes stop_codon:yes gene_type:complete
MYRKWDAVPQAYRFVIVGGIGTIIGWFIYNAIYIVNPMLEYRASISWSVSYVAGVIIQHGMHYSLTFRESESNYFDSLRGAYFSYSLVLLFSTVFNGIIVEIIEIGHQISWFLTTIISAVMSYFLLRRFSFQT